MSGLEPPENDYAGDPGYQAMRDAMDRLEGAQ